MKYLIFSLLAFCSIISFSQRPGGPPAGMGPIIGGKITNNNAEPQAFAQVGLFTEKDTINAAKLATTREDGRFVFRGIETGRYLVKVQIMGYKPYNSGFFELTDAEPFKKLPIVMLTEGEELKEFVIAENKEMLQNDIGKRVFDVEQNGASTGGTAADVMKSVPAVTVDIDGNVSLRGSANVKILINGKPSGLTGTSRQAVLEQIPANTIESIEVITNPSAKYNPEGTAGILNIILKKNQDDGLNGRVSANYGVLNNYGAGISLNFRKGKFNTFGSYDYRHSDRFSRGSVFRQTTLSDTSFSLSSARDGDRLRDSHTGKLGFDYDINKYNTITLSGNYNTSKRYGDEVNTTTSFDEESNISEYFKRTESDNKPRSSYDLNFDYRKTFKEKRRELTFSAIYSNATGIGTSTLGTQYYLNDTVTLDGNLFQQRSTNDDFSKNLVIQSDYTHPFKNGMSLETGFRTSFRKINNDYVFENNTNGAWVNDTLISNNFLYTENIYATYAIISGKIKKKFGYQFGTRFEYTDTESDQLTTNETFQNDYFNFFPSVALSYDLAKAQKIQATYSRRINRPWMRSLNPFVDVSDPFNWRSGNPYLNPEYIDSYEVGYSKYFDKATFSGAVYYRKTNGMMQRFVELIDPTNNVILVTHQNLNSGQDYGTDITATYMPNRKIRLIGSFTYYYTRVDGTNLDDNALNNAGSWNAKLISNFSIFKNTDFQTFFMYRAPFVTGQGEIQEFVWIDLSLKQAILEKKGSITLRMSDIMDTRQFSYLQSTSTLDIDMTFKRQSRIFYIDFAYKFGNGKAKQRRSKRPTGDDGGGADDMF